MHAILLSFLSFGLGDESTHAAWHPADAGLFLEVPDATALSEVLDETPLMDLLRDKSIQNLLKAVGVAESAQLDGEALEAVPLGFEDGHGRANAP